MADVAALVGIVNGVRDDLADDVETPLEFVLTRDRGRAGDEHLPMHGLGGREPCRRGNELSTGTERQPRSSRPSSFRQRAQTRSQWARKPLVVRHEDVTGGVLAGLRQLEAERLGFVRQEVVRNLDQKASAVAGQGIGADRAAVLEVLEYLQCIFDDAHATCGP